MTLLNEPRSTVPTDSTTQAINNTRPPTRRRRRIRPGRVLAWSAMAALLVVTVFPFYWMVREAFTHNADIFSDFGLVPQRPTAVNFLRVLGLATPEQMAAEAPQNIQTLNTFLGLRNSLIFTALVAVGSVFFSSMAAYSFARLRWPGREAVFYVFLTGLMMPPIFHILPNFVTVRTLGWIDTWPGLIAPYFLVAPFIVFFLRQYYLSIPQELEEAAQLDGLSRWGIYWRIALPLSAPGLSTAIIIQAVMAWNEYLWPLLVTQTERTQVLTSALGSFIRNSPDGAPDWSGFMAAATISVIPLVVFALVLGKKLVNNLGLTAGK